MGNKGEVVASKKTNMTPLFTYTTCKREGGTSTLEVVYKILEEEQIRIMEKNVTVDGRDSSDASILEKSCSFFHRIAAWPKIVLYTDMVKWVIDEANISNREFKTRSQGVIGSFTSENLRHMFHLLEP